MTSVLRLPTHQNTQELVPYHQKELDTPEKRAAVAAELGYENYEQLQRIVTEQNLAISEAAKKLLN